jgi:prepilin-type N-terminal cleavage/methylation domain-containing protein
MLSWLKERQSMNEKAATNQRGVTLLEMAVVAAIVAILATLVSIGVAGQAGSSRAASKASDLAEVQKAVESFVGQNPAGTTTGWPVTGGTLPAAGQFKAVIWTSQFTTPEGKTIKLVPDLLLREPRHSRATKDPTTGQVTENSPDWPTNAVWRIDSTGKVEVNLTDTEY